MPFPRASQAYSRLAVLDLTQIRSGPTTVRQFADWCAKVIKSMRSPTTPVASSSADRSRVGIPEPAP